MALLNDAEQDKRLKEIRHKEGEDLAQLLSQRYGYDYIDLASVMINSGTVKLVPEKMAREANLVVFKRNELELQTGILSPHNEKVAEVISDLEHRGFTVKLYMVSQDGLEAAWQTYKEVSYARAETAGLIEISDDVIKEYLATIKSTADIKQLVDTAVQAKDQHAISKVLEIMLSGAVAIDVSDIHIEPEKELVRLRYRIDGILQDITSFTHETYKFILSRLKLLAGAKLNVTQEAQDGRFSIKIGETDVEVRSSILPSSYQEAVVMRILNPKNISIPMEGLGMDDFLLDIMQQQVRKPNGLILTTGPTGSGKTTTLYAFVKKVRSPQVKIITIEDPVEYHLNGVSQTQVNAEKGYTFHEGLRAAVRQDPDVILVGEIRDNETAQVAVDSALTGHLVFSTLHTNSAAGAIPRLIDLGINPKIIGSALNISLAQRLVRRLCQYCKEEYVYEGKEKEALERLLPPIIKMRPKVEKPEKLWRPVGCDKCTMTGYKGRMSIYEGILMTSDVEKVLITNPGERDIVEASKGQGILSMRQDGVVKALSGITSLAEVERVIGLSEIRE